MAEQNTIFRGPETQEAFYADKVRFWGGFNKATVGGIIFMVLFLIFMVAFVY